MIQLDRSGQGRVVGVRGHEAPLVGRVGFDPGTIRQDVALVIYPFQLAVIGIQRASLEGQRRVLQCLAAGGDLGVLGLAGGGRRFDHEHEGGAGDVIVVVVTRLGRDDAHGADLDRGQDTGIGINGRLTGAVSSVNAVGHSASAGAAGGGQRQLFTIDYGGVAGDGQRLLIVLFCQGDVQRDGEIPIIVAGRLEGEGDLVARLAAGDRIGQQTAVRCEISLGKSDIRAGADAVFAVIAPSLPGGKPRPVRRVGVLRGVRVPLRQIDRFEATPIRRFDSHINDSFDHFSIVLTVGSELCIEALDAQLIQHPLRFLPAPCTGGISLRIGQSDLAELLTVFGCQAGGLRVGRYRPQYPKAHTSRGERAVVLRLAKLRVHIVGSGVQRVRLNVLPLCAAAVGIGGAIVVGHAPVTRPVCQAWRAGRLAVNIVVHADLAVLLSLFDSDIRSSRNR